MAEARQAANDRDDGGLVAGIRFEPGGPLVLCVGAGPGLGRGRRVLVAAGDCEREGVVALEPELVIAAPPLPDAPRIIAVLPDVAAHRHIPTPVGALAQAPRGGNMAGEAVQLPPDADGGGEAASCPADNDTVVDATSCPAGEGATGEVVFLPAQDGGIGPADLALALRLAALPVPEPPEPRR